MSSLNKPEFIHDGKVAALAAGKVQSSNPGGRRQANGEIVWSGNIANNETITINGVVFTAKTSGATGNQFNVDSTLTLSLDALVTVLNASAVAAVAKATYSKGGSTKLLVSHDAYGAEGNDFTLAASVGVPSGAKLTGGLTADAINLDADTYALVTVAGAANQYDLPAGDEGQEITVYLKTKGSGANAVITGAFAGGTTLTLDTVGEYAKMKFMNATWQFIANTGAVT